MRTRWKESPSLFVALGVIGLVLVVWHYRAAQRGQISPPERLVLSLLAPVQRQLGGVGRSAGEEWQSLRSWRQLARETRSLRHRVADLEAQNLQMLRYRAENERLRKLVQLDPEAPAKRVAAEVISVESDHGARRLWLNRGSADGIRGDSESEVKVTGDPVVSEAGLVGRVLRCDADRSYVLLLTDQAASVGARCVRSGAIGIVRGNGGACQLEYLDQNADVREGDLLITSGLGGVFPKGLQLGKVSTVRKDIRRPTQVAEVEPLATLDRLDQVFILIASRSRR